MTPLVSIIVTCFNQASYIERAVKSVLSQTFSDIECIIVDDGSADNSQEVAKQLMSLDPRVSYFYKENCGVSSARNFGFKQAQGKWIQFLDGDDWIHEDKIRFQLSHVSALDKEDTIFYTDYETVFIDKEGKITKRQENIVGALTREQLIQRLLIPDFLADSPFPLLQQCLLISRGIFHELVFDEGLKALEDRDFPLNLLLAGVNFVHTPMVGAFYTKHQFNMTSNWSYMKNSYIMFYETVCGKHQELIPLSQMGINFFLKEAMREKEDNNFYRLVKMVQFPVDFFNQKIYVNQTSLVKLIYKIRLIIPSFLIYEKYRGPRSRKIISLVSKLINRQPVDNDSYISSQ